MERSDELRFSLGEAVNRTIGSARSAAAMIKRQDDGGSVRRRLTEHVAMHESFFPSTCCQNSTLGMPEELQSTVYQKLRMKPGDRLVLESPGGRRLEGVLLVKPTDCVLVKLDNHPAQKK